MSKLDHIKIIFAISEQEYMGYAEQRNRRGRCDDSGPNSPPNNSEHSLPMPDASPKRRLVEPSENGSGATGELGD